MYLANGVINLLVLLLTVSAVSAQCWSSGPLSDNVLALLVQNSFPAGTISATGENIQAVAFAVAKAESAGNPSACSDCGISKCRDNDNPSNSSIGLWQINLRSHPEYDRESLFAPNYNAHSALQISSNGQNWTPWRTYKNKAYQSYLGEAIQALGLETTPLASIPETSPQPSTQPALSPVTLTLYLHEGNQNGPIIQDAQITIQDGSGNTFHETTDSNGTVTIRGDPGIWSFTASANRYETSNWSQTISNTCDIQGFLKLKQIQQQKSSIVDVRDTGIQRIDCDEDPGECVDLILFSRWNDALACYKGKLECYNRALDQDPNNSHLWYSKGNALDFIASNGGGYTPNERLALYEEAINAFNKAINLSTSSEELSGILREKDVVLERMGKSQSDLTPYSSSLTKSPFKAGSDLSKFGKQRVYTDFGSP